MPRLPPRPHPIRLAAGLLALAAALGGPPARAAAAASAPASAIDEHMISMQMRAALGAKWLATPAPAAIRAVGAAQAMLRARGAVIDRREAVLIVDREIGRAHV